MKRSARIIGRIEPARVVSEDPQGLREPLFSAGRYTFRAWCAIRGRERRFSLPAAVLISYEIDGYRRMMAQDADRGHHA